MNKWIAIIVLINPLTAIWLLFYIGSFVEPSAWYGFPYFITSVIFCIATGVFDFFIIEEKIT